MRLDKSIRGKVGKLTSIQIAFQATGYPLSESYFLFYTNNLFTRLLIYL